VAVAIGLLLFYMMGAGIVILYVAILGVTVAVDRMHRYLAKKKWDDERTWIIATYASMNALVTGVIIIFGLQLLAIFRVIPDMQSAYLLALVNAIIFLTFAG
jgi:hypothetical protein